MILGMPSFSDRCSSFALEVERSGIEEYQDHTLGMRVSAESLAAFIRELPILADARDRLLALSPAA